MMVLTMRVPFVAQREPWVHAVQMTASFVEQQIMKNLAWFRRMNITDAMNNVKTKNTHVHVHGVGLKRLHGRMRWWRLPWLGILPLSLKRWTDIEWLLPLSESIDHGVSGLMLKMLCTPIAMAMGHKFVRAIISRGGQ